MREARRQTMRTVEAEMTAWGWTRTATYQARGNLYYLYFRCDGR